MLFNRKAKWADGHALAALADGGARRVGADLAAARERLGWTLPDIAAHLRIRLPFLAAIEDGRIEELPGNAYAVGFVRTYAKALGLDPAAIARRFRAEAAQVGHKTELAFPAPAPERGVPAGAVVLLGAVLVIGAYVGWYRASSVQPGHEPVRPMPERLADLVPPTPFASPPVASTAVVAASAPVPPPAIVTPLPVIPPSSAAAAVTNTALTVALSPAAAPATLAALPEGTRIVLRARAEAWMQVRDRQGQVLLNRVLRAGESWPVPAKGQFLLTTGNAGGTELLVDGVMAPSLGADGSVRRDLPLEPELIRDGKLPAPVAVVVRPPVSPPAVVRTP